MKKKIILLAAITIITVAFQTSPYARRIRPFSSTPVACQENEIGYNMTSHALVICTNAGYVVLATGSSGSFAPSNATFITQTANATLTNEQVLASLATGILKNTTTTGILSIAAAGTDYENPLTFTASDFDRTVNAISIDYTNGQAASGSSKGFLTSGDWTTFNNKETTLTFSSPLVRTLNDVACATCLTANQTITLSGDVSGSGTTAITTTIGINKITGAMIAMGSDASGDILYYDGTDYVRLAKGSDSNVLTLASGIPSWATASGGSLGSGNINMTVANDAGTGTTTALLAKLTGAPSTVRNAQTSDTENAIGICTAGCGTTGNATVAIAGQVSCQFDGSTTAGNYVVISATSAGKCHDNGSSFPNDKAAYGRVLTTNVGAGTYSMTLMTPDIAFQNAGNGKSKPGGSDTQVQFNDSGVFGGDAGLTYNKTTDILTSVGGIFPSSSTVVPFGSTTLFWGSGFFDNLTVNAANGYKFFSSAVSGGILRDSGTFGSSPRGGILDFSDSANGGATLALRATTPAQITSNQNNYAPAVGFLQRWSSDATRSVTGFIPTGGNKNGQMHKIVNIGSFNITIVHESASSTAGNRFLNSTGADLTLLPNQSVTIVYDSTTARWRTYPLFVNNLIYSNGTPSIAGNGTLNSNSKDSAGKITSTGTGASTVVLTFSVAFANAPACVVTNETTSNLVRPVSTTTTLTINATVVTGDSIAYICTGY